MKKAVLFIAMSLDGYVADKDGSVAWLSGDGSDENNMGSYESFINTVDTVILGRKTYTQIVTELSPDNWVYAGMKSYVLTREKHESTDEIVFTDKDVCELITEIREQDGKDIWICGGAQIANSLHAKGLIDRYHVSVIPTILGEGTRLFDKHESAAKLKLVKTENYNGIVDLVYEK